MGIVEYVLHFALSFRKLHRHGRSSSHLGQSTSPIRFTVAAHRTPAALPGIKTPLTQRHRREAKDSSVEQVSLPKAVHVCRGCGNAIHRQSAECLKCAQGTRAKTMRDVARVGRLASRQPDAREKLSRTAHKQAVARFCWNASQLPSWLTRESFIERVHPGYCTCRHHDYGTASMCRTIMRRKFARAMSPHPRHWLDSLPSWLGHRASSLT